MSPRRGQGATRALSKPEIVEMALRLIARDGSDQLTVRSLAVELGVTPMAIYRHVRNKDDILLAVTDVLLAQVRPRRSDDWERTLRAMANSLRKLLREHPELVGVFHRQAVTTPAARARLDQARATLIAAGFSERRAVEAYAAVHTYTLGFCGLERARARGGVAPVEGEEPEAREIRGFVTEHQFTAGLDALLRGLASQQAEPGGAIRA